MAWIRKLPTIVSLGCSHSPAGARCEEWGSAFGSMTGLTILILGLGLPLHAQQEPATSPPPGPGGSQRFAGMEPAARAQPPDEARGQDRGDLAVEGLIDLEVLLALEVQTAAVATVSEQDIERTPASITKITANDLIRTGLDSLAESMRLVPGARVARDHRGSHAVAIRGAPGVYQTQLLASRDGRPIYSPSFAGIQWAKEDYLLQDLEGIEVIRGPGSTVWGANAVNGIINIVTKSAFDTQGLLFESRVGTHERPMVQLRWGGHVSEDTAYRLFGKWFDREGFPSTLVDREFNDHSFGMAGFRVDTRLSEDSSLTISGEYGASRAQILSTNPIGPGVLKGTLNESGGHLLGIYRSRPAVDSELELAAYLDWAESSAAISGGESRRLVELKGTYTTPINDSLELVTGASARYVLTALKNTGLSSFPDTDESMYQFSTFAQLTWEWIPDVLWLTGGSKFEVNSRSGFEFQPSIRLTWVPVEEHTLWTAVSRSVRTPSLIDRNLFTTLAATPPAMPGQPGTLTTVSGNPEFDSEQSVVFEGGWRWRPRSNLFLETTGFVGFYDDVRAIGVGTPFLGMGPGGLPVVTIPARFENGGQQVIPGFEVRVSYRPTSYWTLDAHYSFLKPDFEEDDYLGAIQFEGTEAAVPKNAIHLRSYLDLGDDWSWNLMYWWQNGVRENQSGGVIRGPVHRLDTTIQWRPTEGVQVTLGGRNLLESSNAEWLPEVLDASARVERELWIGVELRF